MTRAMGFGSLVAAGRGRLGWTQKQLADHAGMRPFRVSQIERGVGKAASLCEVERIMKALKFGR